MSKQEYELKYQYIVICEQIFDYIGVEEGIKKCYELFPDFKTETDIIRSEYENGNRMSKKLDVPDEGILNILK